ncbi:MAG: PAS domain S-box protein [Firmicutes bacterium]|nr:PAS domain S-box protein [Bacillota bacterium]
MTKKIFRSILLVAMLVFFACFGIIMAVMYGYFSDIQQNKLKDQTDLAVHGVTIGGMDYLESLHTEEYRITWIAEDGVVLYDSDADAATMENHADREEVTEAQRVGVGESERYSTTLSTKTFYRAAELMDGSVLRVSVTQYTVLSLLLGMIQPILIVFLFALILSLVLAHNLSKRIVGPMNCLDLDHPLENDAYDELSPLLSRMEQQHREIVFQKEELERKQEEFTLVTDHMDEGLVLLNERGVILSINTAAKNLFGTTRNCIGKDFLTVDRSLPLQNAIKATFNGQHGEVLLERDGRTYQVKTNAILRDGGVRGAVLLSFDVTEENLAEQHRREFSANVSHELKSPLQAIMGSAELMENGLVKEEDRPMFIGRIRSEAERLVILIDDIIRLSQLDEGGEFPYEDIDLLALTNEIKEELEEKAEKRNITIAVLGDAVSFRGVRRLISEIIYNLCDNALKYNKEYGTVTMVVRKDEDYAVLTVADTGIGIPEEHLDRIFERFYRVDKSHSRETGGTGLGLSIVKHAAQFHNAIIDVKSSDGKGTTFTVKFPL